MLMSFYRFISDILSFPIFIYFLVRLIFSKEDSRSIKEKFFFNKIKRPKGDLIWINGVSIGEAKTGVVIADEIKKNKSQSTILLSTSTITSYNLLSKSRKNYILIYSPLDINFIIRRFINYWKPSSTIFIESEIWPNIFFHLKKNSTKLNIFNARISEKSFKNWNKINFLAKKIFKLVDIFFVQDNDSILRFKKLGAKKIQRIENLKFLSQKLEVNEKNYNFLKNKLKEKRIVTLFSSHANEEALFLECYKNLSKKIKNLFFIIIPRHLKRVNKITKEFENKKISYLLKTRDSLKIIDENFLIVDTFGELGLFFKLSEVTVVGGSFFNRGGHNPIETNGFKCSIIFGPYMDNFKDIKEKILEHDAGFEVKNVTELVAQISKVLINKKLNIKTYKNFKKLCDEQSNKSKLILKSLLK